MSGPIGSYNHASVRVIAASFDDIFLHHEPTSTLSQDVYACVIRDDGRMKWDGCLSHPPRRFYKLWNLRLKKEHPSHRAVQGTVRVREDKALNAVEFGEGNSMMSIH